MDLLESFFGKITERIKKNRKNKFEQYSVNLEDHFYTVNVLAQGAMGLEPVMIKPYERSLGVVLPDCILLPKSVCFFQDQDLNRDLLFHQALVAGTIQRLKLKSQYPHLSSILERCIEIYLHREIIQKKISALYPEYNRWSDDLFQRFNNALAVVSKNSESDVLCRSIFEDLETFKSNSPFDLNSTKSQIDKFIKLEKKKRFSVITRFPSYALAPWCELIREKKELADLFTDFEHQEKNKSKSNSQRKSKGSTEIETVDIEKEKKKENPVTHSFEKLETVDEYQGGYRHADGSDQLEEHENALDEVDLKHVVRGGESTQSIYQADISDLVESAQYEQRETTTSPEIVLLPEWDYKQSDFKRNYCQLMLEAVQVPTVTNRSASLSWYTDLIQNHATDLCHWKQSLESLLNQRRWKDRQWEGAEISIDAYVRYLAEAKGSYQTDSRLYLRDLRHVRELSVFVLIDQSMSTDSWVMNRRVLDVELESIAMMSYLVGDLRGPIAVAGTYSHTRHHCSFNLYKNFNSDWNDFLSVAPLIQPTGYTRLGPSIRYATDLLVQHGGHKKLLILLTDGKPTDYDRYEGRYGIEDISHAHLEAGQKGVQIRAIAIEKDAKNYFPHMFGKNEYQIIQNPTDLPEALFRIYFDACYR